MILPNGRVPDKTSREQNLVSRLEDTLEVRGKTLGEGELFGNAVEANAPGDMTLLAGDFEQSVEAAGDG